MTRLSASKYTGVNDPEREKKLERFKREARTVVGLQHPHIVPMVDYGVIEADQVPYMVMSYMEGGTLESQINGALLPLDQVMHWLQQITSALAYIHEKSSEALVHRDVKPSNVLLDLSGNAYLSDFGIAQPIADTSQTTSSFFSPKYAAPEQVTNPIVTASADTFSLALVVWELLSGQQVPERDRPHDVLTLLSVGNHRNDISASRVDAVLAKATAYDPAARYSHVGDFAEALRSALFGLDGAETYRAEVPWRGENPYMGLVAFGEEQAANFYGREALTDSLVTHMGQPGRAGRMLAVIGPSGSGKSSLLQAGLIHRLKAGALPGSDRWIYKQINAYGNDLLRLLDVELTRDTANPPGTLQTTLENADGLLSAVEWLLPRDKAVQMVLVLDQFEEVFTQVTDADLRRHFLDLLTRAVTSPHSRLRLVIGLRADFYDGPMQHRDFGRLVDDYNMSVLPMSQDELRAAVIEPAHRVGLRFEGALEESIIAEAEGQPGSLPLLQYLLSEMVQRDSVVGSTLRRQTYTELGGVAQALGNQADALYDTLDDDQRRAIRQVFLRLVTVGEDDGSKDTRRRVNLSEVSATHPEAAYVVDLFARRRLLTLDRRKASTEPTAEVAHEALIRTWGRLRDWLDAARRELPTSRELTTLTANWLNKQRSPDLLVLFGERLLEMEQFAVQTDIELTPSEREYVAACRQRLEALEAEREGMLADLKAQQVRTEASARVAEAASARAKRDRRVAVGMIVAALIVSIGVFLFFGAQIADRSAQISQLNDELLVGEMSREARSLSLIQRIPIALDAFDRAPNSTDGLALLFESLSAAPAIVRELKSARPNDTSEVVLNAIFSPDGNRLYVNTVTTLQVYDLSSEAWLQGSPVEIFSYPNRPFDSQFINAFAVSPDGTTILAGFADGSLKLLNSENMSLMTNWEAHEDVVNSLSFSADGTRYLSASQDGTVAVWDADTQDLLYRYTGDGNPITFAAFTPDSSGVISRSGGSSDSNLRAIISFWDSLTGEAKWDPIVLDRPDAASTIAVSPDGDYIFYAIDNRLSLLDSATGSAVSGWPLELPGGNSSTPIVAAFTPDSSQILLGLFTGEIQFRNLDGEETFTERGHMSAPQVIAFRPGSSQFLSISPSTFNAPLQAFLWDTDSGVPRLSSDIYVGYWSAQPLMPGGQSYFAFQTDDGDESTIEGIVEIDLNTNQILRQLAVPHEITGLEVSQGDLLVSPNGKWLVTTYSNQSVAVFNLQDGTVKHCPQRTTGDQSEYWPGIAISPDSILVASESPFEDSTIILWDLTSPDCPIQQHLADTETRDLLRAANNAVPGFSQFADEWRRMNTITFSPDGRYLYTGASFALDFGETDITNQLLRWDLATGEIFRFQVSGMLPTTVLTISPDGSRIAIGDPNGVTIRDSVTGHLQVDLSGIGHESPIWDLAFSPDGSRIASVDRAGIGLIRDAGTGRQIGQFGSATDRVVSFVYTPDGSYILALSQTSDSSSSWLRIADPALAAEWLEANRYQQLIPFNRCALYNITPSRCEPPTS